MHTLSGHEAIMDSGSRLLRRIQVPGVDLWLLVHRDYAPIFAAHARDYHDNVAHLRTDPLECWSYAYRPPRMGHGVSDHAGYAADYNSNHEGAPGRHGGMATMTTAQKTACRDLALTYSEVLAWGGSPQWGGSPYYANPDAYDPMHWFVRPGAHPSSAAHLMARLHIDNNGVRGDPLVESDKEWFRQTLRATLREAVDQTSERIWHREVAGVSMGAINVTTYTMMKSIKNRGQT